MKATGLLLASLIAIPAVAQAQGDTIEGYWQDTERRILYSPDAPPAMSSDAGPRSIPDRPILRQSISVGPRTAMRSSTCSTTMKNRSGSAGSASGASSSCAPTVFQAARRAMRASSKSRIRCFARWRRVARRPAGRRWSGAAKSAISAARAASATASARRRASRCAAASR